MSTIEYNWNCVAFIDVLGQKEAFKESGQYFDTIEKYLSSPQELEKKIKSAHSDTYESIVRLREEFQGFFRAYTELAPPSTRVPEEKQALFKEMNKASVQLQVFSDCLVADCSLKPEKHYSNVINSVYGILMACGSLLLLSLASRKPFRAGIDIGYGIKLPNNEIYGPALFRAYELESNIAQYPRIVVGQQLINFLGNLSLKNPQLEKQEAIDIEWCKKIADICLGIIKVDLDGVACIDYLSEDFVKDVKAEIGEEKFDDICRKARDYVGSEYERWRKGSNQKLAQRYYFIWKYINSRLADLKI